MNLNDTKIVDKDFIMKLLESLNEELVKRSKSLTVVIYGGSSLCLLTTFSGHIDTMSSDDLLNECLASIGITDDLVNTEMRAFINKVESLNIYKEYSNLVVKVPTLEYLVALKCRSARDKDLLDLKNLCKVLKIENLAELRKVFIKFYSPIMFNRRRIEILKQLFE